MQVKKEMQCYRYDHATQKPRRVHVVPNHLSHVTHAVHHMSCAKLRFPPKFGSWAFQSCVSEMIGP